MKQIRSLFFVIAVVLGLSFSVQTVQAAGMGGPNTGDYVYEDQEYITNGQYDQLEKLNDNIYSNVSPQRLYVLIFKNSEDVDQLVNTTEADIKSNSPERAIINKAGEALYGSSHYYDMETDDGADLESKNNYLIMDLRDNKVFFCPSLQGSLYITDLVFWKTKFGLSSQLKSSDIDIKINALFQLANNLEPKLQTVSENKKMLESKSIYDVKSTITNILLVLGAILIIIIIWAIHKYNKNHPHRGGGGSELGNSDYDAGFDEGYYMGSNDPFM